MDNTHWHSLITEKWFQSNVSIYNVKKFLKRAFNQLTVNHVLPKYFLKMPSVCQPSVFEEQVYATSSKAIMWRLIAAFPRTWAPTEGRWFLSQGWTCYYRSPSTSILENLQQVLREGTPFLFLGKPWQNPDLTALALSYLSYIVMILYLFVWLTNAYVPLLIGELYKGRDQFHFAHDPVEHRHRCSVDSQIIKPYLR